MLVVGVDVELSCGAASLSGHRLQEQMKTREGTFINLILSVKEINFYEARGSGLVAQINKTMKMGFDEY